MNKKDFLQTARLRNAKELLHSECEGVSKTFAQRIDRAESYTNNVLNGKRAIGEKMARHIEDTFGKPNGFLDDIHSSKSEPMSSVPVIARDQISLWLNKKPLTKDVEGGIAVDGHTFPNRSYAVINKDSSLEPRIMAGDTVVLAPEEEPDAGDIIAVDFHGEGILTLGKLTYAGAQKVLKVNQGKTIELPSDISKIYCGKLSMVIFDQNIS